MSAPGAQRTLVIIAAYNEEATIGAVVAEVMGRGYDVVVINDGSADSTARLAKSAGAVVIEHPVNLGQGAALQTGIDYALSDGAQIIVTFDGDGQHRPADIDRLVDALTREKADFVLGSRFLGDCPTIPAIRRCALKAATLFTRATTGLRVTDTHNGLRALSRRGAGLIRLRQNGMAHASEFLSQVAASRLRYVEIPVTIDYTPYSLAKGQRTRELIAVLLDLLVGRLIR